MKQKLIKLINRMLSVFNLKLSKNNLPSLQDFNDVFVSDREENRIIDLQKVSGLAENIIGMISHRAGEELFSLAYMQQLEGDVIEVGSFQGKSTFFLGMAVKFSVNGHVYAIDHFQGNKGKEQFYVVENSDLSDLEGGFRRNIDRSELSEHVTLINKPNETAVNEISDSSARLLFIDADHTAEGVSKDLELFIPKLKSNAIVIFDDYDRNHFSGLVEVVNDFIEKTNPRRKYLLGRSLILEL